MAILNSRDLRPGAVPQEGVLVSTVTLHFTGLLDDNGQPMYRIYECGYPPQLASDGTPQGGRIYHHAEEIGETLFPIIKYLNLEADPH